MINNSGIHKKIEQVYEEINLANRNQTKTSKCMKNP